MKWSCTWNNNNNQLRNGHKSKRNYTVQWCINRWPYVHQIILLFSLALNETYAVFKVSFARIPHVLRCAHGTGHKPFCGIFFNERQPYFSQIILVLPQVVPHSPRLLTNSAAGSQSWLATLSLWRLLLRSFLLLTSEHLPIISVARGCSSQLSSSLRWEFIPWLPPITGLVWGVPPLELYHPLWHLTLSVIRWRRTL